MNQKNQDKNSDWINLTGLFASEKNRNILSVSINIEDLYALAESARHSFTNKHGDTCVRIMLRRRRRRDTDKPGVKYPAFELSSPPQDDSYRRHQTHQNGQKRSGSVQQMREAVPPQAPSSPAPAPRGFVPPPPPSKKIPSNCWGECEKCGNQAYNLDGEYLDSTGAKHDCDIPY